VLLAFTAGCSGSSPDQATAATSTRPAAVPEPFYGMSNVKVLAKVADEAKGASSVHVVAWARDGKKKKTLAANLKMTQAGLATGILMNDGTKVAIRRVGKVIYLKGDRKYWSWLGYTSTNSMANRWIKVTKKSKVFQSELIDSYFFMTRPARWLEEFADVKTEGVEDLIRQTGVLRRGTQTTTLADAPLVTPSTNVLYISSTGPSYPLELSSGYPKREQVLFRGWNTTVVKVVAPEGAPDLETFE
jgi:hypothetical protein